MSLGNRLYEFIKEGNIDEAKSLLSSAGKVDDAAELLPSLQEAAVSGNMELFDLIVRAGADVKAVDKMKESILMYASKGGSVDIVKLLLASGADANVITKNEKKTALMFAAEKGHVGVVEALVCAGAYVNAVDDEGWTVLMHASQGGSVDIVKLLLAAGADANVVDKDEKMTALMFAAKKGHVGVVDALVRAGASVNAVDVEGWTVLMYASKGGSIDIVKLLLSGGADVNAVSKDRLKKTALLLAAEQCHVEVVEVLIGSGASLDAVDGDICTAMLYAVKGRSVKMAELLLAGGADMNALDKMKESVLMHASKGGSVGIVKLLLAAGADVNVVSERKKTALMFALENCQVDVADALIGAGASVSTVDDDGQTPLMYAALGGSVAAVKLLLAAEVDVNVASQKGKTALMFALEKCRVDVVDVLIRSAASLSALDNDGKTTLMYAALGGNVDLVNLLLSAGADVNTVSTDWKSKTALLLAAEKGHAVVVDVLIGAGANVNSIDGDGVSALMHASSGGLVNAVKLLLSTGAEVNRLSEMHKTALSLAVEKGHIDVVEILIGAGASVIGVDWDGWSALMHASKLGSEVLVKLLLSAGADVHVVSKMWEKTALLLAVEQGHVGVVRVLVGVGAALSVDGLRTLAPIFTVQRYCKYKEAVCTSDLLTLKVLQNNHNDVWCLLVQVTDIPGIEDLVRGIVEKHPQLVDAKDVKGRAAVDLATPVLRQTINSVRLWFGKYRPVSGKPEHTSSTCFVIKCMDESVEGEPVAVALKLMRVRAQFERETEMRKFGFDGEYVMIQTESYPNRPLSESDPAVVEVSSAELTGVLTKAVAERLYCVVMPFADRNMFVAMKQERFAGKEDVSEVVMIFSQLVKCVMHMHGKGVLHGDIKPMNLVRMGAKWLLIDLDACCVVGRDSVGFKSSSAYIPPETVLCDAVGGVVKVKSESVCREYGVSPLVAHESFDVWSLGCILYQLCSEGVLPLFAANQDDNLNINAGDGENSLWSLGEWSEKLKASKLSRVLNQQAKNLLSLMLSKDPLKRPSLSRVLSHPFLSGRSYGRVAGEEAAAFDVFISYRVSTDLKHAARLYDMLTGAGLRVWWDKKCLESGKEWQKGFCEGLGNSRSFVCLLSSAGTDVPFQLLGAESACDNVLLEHRLALELKAMDFVQFVFPLMIGDAVDDDDTQLSEYKFTKISNYETVLSVEDSLFHNLDQLGLGTPLNHKPSVSEIVSGIRACNGYFIGGRPANTLENAVQGIVDTLMKKQSSSVTSGDGVDGDPMRSSKSVSSLRNAVNDNRQQVGREGQAGGSVSVEEYNRVIAERDSAMVERDELLRRLTLEVKLNAVV